jgi:pimeloyl-ACP methyl ester carboxylesterase
MATRQTITENIVTSYNESGSGKVVLLLHGWGDTKETFSRLEKELADSYRVISLDLPGFGRTGAPPATWSLSEYVAFVKAFLDKKEIATPYAVVGHSNGGAIAIKGLATDMIHTERLILLASAGIRDTAKGRKRVQWAGAKLAKYPIKVLPSAMQRQIKRRAYTSIGSDIYVAEQLQETFKKIVAEDISELAKRVTVPTLLVYGTDDQATPPQFGERFQQQIANAELKLIEKAGHFVHQERADEVNSLVTEFFK